MADLLWGQLTVEVSWNKQAGTRGDFSMFTPGLEATVCCSAAGLHYCTWAICSSALWLWESHGKISELWAIGCFLPAELTLGSALECSTIPLENSLLFLCSPPGIRMDILQRFFMLWTNCEDCKKQLIASFHWFQLRESSLCKPHGRPTKKKTKLV